MYACIGGHVRREGECRQSADLNERGYRRMEACMYGSDTCRSKSEEGKNSCKANSGRDSSGRYFHT